jgi:hypothetical protein
MEGKELKCIAFVSSAMKDITPDNIKAWAEEAGKLNESMDISDLTIFANGNVLGLLEGPAEAVEKRFEELKKHPSHHSIIKILSTQIDYRSFEGFPFMLKIFGTEEFRALDNFKDHPMKEYFEEFLDLDTPASNAVRNFIKSNT